MIFKLLNPSFRAYHHPYVTIKPVTNQIELHPGIKSSSFSYGFRGSHDMIVTSYGPFMKGEAFTMPYVNELAKKYSKSPAQICIRYLIDRGIIAIPKSVHEIELKKTLVILILN